MTPASGDDLGDALDYLESITKQRKMTDAAMNMQKFAMLQELKKLPADIAMGALKAWPHRRNHEDPEDAKWFPAFPELEKFFEIELEERRLMLAACEGEKQP